MQRSWWIKSLLAIYLLPWALPALTAFISYPLDDSHRVWRFLDSLWRAVTGEDGPLFLVDRWLATATNIVSYIWKWMPFWTLIFIAGRMAIPQDIYEAAEIDGAIGWRRLVHIDLSALGKCLSGLDAAFHIWTIGDFNTAYFVSSARRRRLTDVLATYGFRCPTTSAIRNRYRGHDVGAANLIPMALLLMRRIRHAGSSYEHRTHCHRGGRIGRVCAAAACGPELAA